MRKEFELYQDEEGYIYDITTDLEQIIIRDLYKAMKRNNEKTDEIERLNNVIEEVREYITSYINQFNGVYPPVDMRYLDLNKILEILDKENI